MRTINLETLTLEKGKHANPDVGMCVMEAVAYAAQENFTDHPECVSPVIASFCRSWNDALDDESRQRLKPYIPRLIGTNDGQATEDRLAWMAADWLVRVQAPAWLDLTAVLKPHAVALRGLQEVTLSSYAAAEKPLYAARVAARDAAWDAAWAAARDAAWAAARDAAGAAAGAAARDAARVAARVAAWDAAWAAARDAAWAAARDAARDAAWDALKPTARILLEEAFLLLDRMIAVAKDANPDKPVACGKPPP